MLLLVELQPSHIAPRVTQHTETAKTGTMKRVKDALSK